MESEIKIEILNNEMWLDEYCYKCDNDDELKEECEVCNGKGFNPTELGEAILEFIKRHKE